MDSVIAISKDEWNSIDKPYECRHEADDSDVLVKIGDLYCCCECAGGTNNIICFSLVRDVRNVRNMMRFMVYLHDELGMEYFRVESSKDRYRMFKKAFGMSMLLQKTEKVRDVYWCRVDDGTRARIVDKFLK